VADDFEDFPVGGDPEALELWWKEHGLGGDNPGHKCWWCGKQTYSMSWACFRCIPLKEEGYKRAREAGENAIDQVYGHVHDVLREKGVDGTTFTVYQPGSAIKRGETIRFPGGPLLRVVSVERDGPTFTVTVEPINE
jgi:hypothetical protein